MTMNNQTPTSSGGQNRMIVYAVVALVALGIIFFAARAYWGAPGEAPPAAATSEPATTPNAMAPTNTMAPEAPNAMAPNTMAPANTMAPEAPNTMAPESPNTMAPATPAPAQ